MRKYRVRFYDTDGTFITDFIVEAELDGVAIENATKIFHIKFPKEAANPFQVNCGYLFSDPMGKPR